MPFSLSASMQRKLNGQYPAAMSFMSRSSNQTLDVPKRHCAVSFINERATWINTQCARSLSVRNAQDCCHANTEQHWINFA